MITDRIDELLVPPGRPKALAAAVVHLLSDRRCDGGYVHGRECRFAIVLTQVKSVQRLRLYTDLC
jgi:hypothetical protein